jgi:hypothetical protein
MKDVMLTQEKVPTSRVEGGTNSLFFLFGQNQPLSSPPGGSISMIWNGLPRYLCLGTIFIPGLSQTGFQ